MEEVVVDIKAIRKINETDDGKLTVQIATSKNEDKNEVSGTKDQVEESRGNVLCRNFQKYGKCKQGYKCKFRHDLNCTFFESQTGCKYGDQCPLQHYRGEADASYEQDSQVALEEVLNISTEGKELEQELQKLSLLESESQIDKFTKACMFFKRGKCIKEDCQFSHEKNDETDSISKETSNNVDSNENNMQGEKVCNFFQTEKGCKWANCRFLHLQMAVGERQVAEVDNTKSALADEPDEKLNRTEQIVVNNRKEIQKEKIETKTKHESSSKKGIEKAPTKNSEKQGRDQYEKRKICKFFNTKKGCREGFNCPNLHEKQALFTDENNVPLSEQSKSPEESQEKNNEKKVKCRFFKTRRGCRDGLNCPNVHEEQASSTEENNVPLSKQSKPSDESQEENNEKKVKCRFFKTKRGCRNGLNCPNIHEEQASSTAENDHSLSEQNNLSDKSQKKVICKFFKTERGCFKGTKCPNLHEELSNNTAEEKIHKSDLNVPEKTPLELRATELKQLEKRWKGHFECLQTEPATVYNVAIAPTDPDWPFVVKDFLLQLEFPEDYPEQLFKVTLQENSQYPQYFCGFINEILQNWCEERSKTRNNQDLAFRPFCRWFDKTLKDNFQFAATKVKRQLQANAFGITLVHHKSILQHNENAEDNDEKEEATEEEGVSSTDELPMNGSTEDSNQLFHDEKEVSVEKCSTYVKKGTEIKLPHLQISEKIGTLRIRGGLLVVQCDRCRDKHDYKVFSKQMERRSCKKCHQEQSVVYHSELIHHFSPIAGYLHLTNCKAFDFIMNDSTIILNCLDCNKDNTIKGLVAGTKKDHWCQHCNVKMEMKIPNVHFNKLQPVATKFSGKGTSKAEEGTKKKIPKGPGIKEGQPLPDNGSCKHYKKSHRWLRFPCCGKAYPCDICHEEGVEGDHEMKFASKMICGFCSKEQPFFKDKPCVSCKSGVTKGRSAHWEGGQGCRDKSKMARGDKHKTAGQGKTVSKKKEDEGKKTKK